MNQPNRICACGEPIGRCEKDSLYRGYEGPFCFECWAARTFSETVRYQVWLKRPRSWRSPRKRFRRRAVPKTVAAAYKKRAGRTSRPGRAGE